VSIAQVNRTMSIRNPLLIEWQAVICTLCMQTCLCVYFVLFVKHWGQASKYRFPPVNFKIFIPQFTPISVFACLISSKHFLCLSLTWEKLTKFPCCSIILYRYGTTQELHIALFIRSTAKIRNSYQGSNSVMFSV
jgi:hypothetical protein